MPQNFTVLDDEVGIQLNQQDIPNEEPLINNLYVGKFKRGCLDRSMTVTLDNIRAVLGHDIRNKDYVAVRDLLDTGVHRVKVLRIIDNMSNLPDPEPEPEEPEPTEPPIEPPHGETILQDFEFAVIRYIWTEQGGRDLDTRTRITNPSRNVDVGWNRSQSDGQYLIWGGDNTSSGIECVLLNIKQMSTDFNDQNTLRVDCKCFWYSAVASGNLKIQFATYKNGSMQQNGYDFINVGGQLVQDITLDCNSMTQQQGNADGDLIAYLTYNKTMLTGTLTRV